MASTTMSGSGSADGGVDVAVVVGRTQVADQVRLGARGDPVEDVHVESSLHAQQGGQQADRPRAGDQDAAWLEPGPLTDLLDLVPGLGDDRRRLHEHAHLGQPVVELDGVRPGSTHQTSLP